MKPLPLSIVILAAGQGKRMKSNKPKCLHPLAGKPMLQYVLDAAESLQPQAVYVVIGHAGDQLRAQFADEPVTWVEQTEPKGTGHAVQQAMPHIPDNHQVLILNGDMPLLTPETLGELWLDATPKQLVMLTAIVDDPTGYGRILRDTDDTVIGVVEEKDADINEQMINEVNTNAYVANAAQLRGWLENVKNDNVQQEYYLPDIIPLARDAGCEIVAKALADELEVANVNSRQELADLEAICQEILTDDLMDQGATLLDPDSVHVRGHVKAGRDVTVDAGVIFEGEVFLGEGCQIGPYSVIKDASIGPGAVIKSHSTLDQVTVEAHASIGPFARLRPGTHIHEHARIGNFVEVKKSEVGAGSKINHLSYIGDAKIGEDVNVGAGVITCNYDGVNKHETVINDRAFIGSDVQLVAPVAVGEDATIGAGSTIIDDAPPQKLTLSRPQQVTSETWARPEKAQAREEKVKE